MQEVHSGPPPFVALSYSQESFSAWIPSLGSTWHSPLLDQFCSIPLHGVFAVPLRRDHAPFSLMNCLDLILFLTRRVDLLLSSPPSTSTLHWIQIWAQPSTPGFWLTVHFSSVTQSCPTLCDHMDCSMPGFPVDTQQPEFTQTHVHWVGDAIQPSHPLSSPFPPAFNLSSR